MPKELIFFCCACCILVFTIINLSVGPFISGTLNSYWGTENCAYLKDKYDNNKKGGFNNEVDKIDQEFDIDECIRKKGMHDMEYTSFIFDIYIGFICGLLGLLHLFSVGNDFKQKTGIIGLVCGIIGFILTFVYVIFNGIVYTNHYDNENIYKTDSDGVFAELETGKGYKCNYFDKANDKHPLIAKYSDLIQKQYNYDKDMIYDKPNEFSSCKRNPNLCVNNGYISAPSLENTCKKLYYENVNYRQGITNKNISDRFLTTLILSLFVCIANIGLVIFGFLLFKNQGESVKLVESKN